MKFMHATIHGFGKWTDTTIDFSDELLICFYGENEAGKSTLQQFLLYMLFGLGPKKRKFYQPKNRTEIGGSLSLYDEQFGMLTIHRKEDTCKCLLEDGTSKEEIWWKEHLAGLTRDVYTSIYAFSAVDLQPIQTMKAKELSDILFSVGLTGSIAIYEVEKKLLTRLDNLYKGRGHKPLINKKIIETEKAYQLLKEEQAKEATYHSLIQQLHASEENQLTSQQEAEILQKELLKNEKIIQILPDIHQLYHTQQKLKEMPKELFFPKDGVERLRDVKEAMLPLKSERKFIDNKIDEYTEKQNDLSKQIISKEALEEAATILGTKTAYDQRKFIQQEKENQYAKWKEQCQVLLYELEWETNQTVEYSFPFHLETSWQELLENHQELHAEKNKLKQEHTIRNEKRAQLSQELDTLYDQLLPNEQQEYMEAKLRKDRKATQDDEENKWGIWVEKKKKQATFTLYGSAILAMILFMIALFNQQPLLYILPVLSVIIGVLQFVFTKQQIQTMSHMLGENVSGPSLTANERQSFQQQLERQEEHITAIHHIKQTQKQLEYEEAQYMEATQMQVEKEKRMQTTINETRTTYPFLQGLEVAHWIELLRMIRELQKVDRSMEELQKEIKQLKVKNGEIDNQLAAFSEGHTYEEIQTALDTQKSVQQFQRQYEGEMKELGNQKEIMDEQIEQLQNQMHQLFLAANVSTEEDYYEQASLLEQKEQLQRTESKLSQKLQTVFSEEFIYYLLDKRPQEVDLEATIELEKTRLKEKQTMITNYHKEIAQLRVEIEQLEGKEDASAIAYRFQIEKDSLNEMRKQWSTLKLAYAALQNAKQAYQEKYMTEIIKWTTIFFEKLTQGRYVNVFPPTEKDLFQVEGTENIRYTVHELSQGTIDQLYVSLRFAIAKVMSDTYQVPILVDDAFVHFDDERTKQATTLLENMAEEQQVLFFTCKQRTKELLNVTQLRVEALEWA